MHRLLRIQVNREIRMRRRFALTLLLLVLLFFMIRLTFGNSGLIRYLELRERRDRLAQEIKDLDNRNTCMRSDVKHLREDPFYIEKHAREDFNMAKPDEYVFKYEE